MTKKTTKPGRIPLALLLAPAISWAQVDTSDWACESCPFDAGYRATIDAGATAVSDDAARYGNYTGHDEKGAYADVGARGRYNGDGYRVDYALEDLGLDSRAFELTVGSEGVFEVHVGYRELPFRRFDTSSTIFSP
ncbi:MAG: MtrB/PioB family outer membrane beta-barrel protein, partial [Proteobacteria bacterium]|nr:MtrB/PioB family outer membrane beta-barrel protein [Pseudomonadota bacterium]